jgi:hypothetical protein
VAELLGYEVIRADEITEPGIISAQILDRVLNDDLVIADLTDRNPNVYYELAVRHAARKPIIQLVQKGEPLPFDVAGTRTILVDHKDLDSVADARKQLTQYIETIERTPGAAFDSPISLAMDLRAMRESSDPQQAGLAEITERMTSVHGSVVSIQSAIDNKLVQKLNQLLRLTAELQKTTRVDAGGQQGAVSELGDRIESLRGRLVQAIAQILGDIQGQHLLLASKIQAVFEEQSETAALSVKSSFTDELERCVSVSAKRETLLVRLLDIFMHGMASMGTFQRINVTRQTEASTEEIREKINKSIKEVFGDIDEIEKQVLALP